MSQTGEPIYFLDAAREQKLGATLAETWQRFVPAWQQAARENKIALLDSEATWDLVRDCTLSELKDRELQTFCLYAPPYILRKILKNYLDRKSTEAE